MKNAFNRHEIWPSFKNIQLLQLIDDTLRRAVTGLCNVKDGNKLLSLSDLGVQPYKITAGRLPRLSALIDIVKRVGILPFMELPRFDRDDG